MGLKLGSVLTLLLFAQPVAAEVQSTAPAFSKNELTSDAGHVSLGWQAEGPVRLEMARKPDFSDVEPIYRGDYESYFLSGLADGTYYLRLRDKRGALSQPAVLTVAHQSLTRAIWLLIVGAIISLGIVVTILRGARQ